ncbi:DUF302 domain-containing protein [Vulgatibacter incomptus]|uniref:Putative exported protein n=1 Tax=Vulgatibacter incomptus TaxID=1391653 RepID=A0A0K1PBM6_9BACT|nr:DUF302 domain-containing protein [Vulgatibacter incomptus]AKU90806.1 putative exported protein [Vulgatibacter incomptus]
MVDPHGLVTIASHHSVQETADRAEELIKSAGKKVFARIDHHAAARDVDLEMPPTQLLIFGDPRAGTPLMLASPTFAIDLPLKLLVWQGSDGRVRISFNSVVWLSTRHSGARSDDQLEAIDAALLTLAKKAAQ